MRRFMLGVVVLACYGGPLAAQTSQSAAVIEVPLRVEGGRMIVTAQDASGADYDFVLGLGMALLTESGAASVGSAMTPLTIGGVPVDTEMSQVVPDSYLSDSDAAGVLGGETLNDYDILIDVPEGRLLIKPIGRAVRWDGVSLSNPVRLMVFHGVLLRAEAQVGGKGVGGLLDFANPGLEVNEPLAFALTDGAVDSFRMGYSGWPALAAEVVDSPIFRGWDPESQGFVVIGAAVAYDCAIAISWVHAELRTCLR
jgi:hypothetical protein